MTSTTTIPIIASIAAGVNVLCASSTSAFQDASASDSDQLRTVRPADYKHHGLVASTTNAIRVLVLELVTAEDGTDFRRPSAPDVCALD